MHPFHRIGRGKWQRPRYHLVENDAERVEIAARIDRAVHPPRLFGRHVGQRARDHLGRLRRLALAPQAGRDAETCQPHLPRRHVDHDVTRRQVLVDDAAAVQCAERRGQTDAEPQAQSDVHRRRSQSLRQQLAAGIVEDQARAPLMLEERAGPDGPRRIQIGAQGVLVFEHLHALGARMLRPGHDDENGGGFPAGGWLGPAADDERTILADGAEHTPGQIDRGKRMARSHRRLTRAQDEERVAIFAQSMVHSDAGRQSSFRMTSREGRRAASNVHFVTVNCTPNRRRSPGRAAMAGGGELFVPVT